MNNTVLELKRTWKIYSPNLLFITRKTLINVVRHMTTWPVNLFWDSLSRSQENNEVS